jgi:hypothetical protein
MILFLVLFRKMSLFEDFSGKNFSRFLKKQSIG